MSKLLIGAEGGLYVNNSVFDSAVWVEVLNVRDVGPKAPWDKAEFTSRETPVKLTKKSLIGIEISVQMRADPDSAVYQTWVDAAMERTSFFDLLVLNAKRTVAGARGLRGNFLVSMDEEPQVLADGTYSTFTLSPTLDDDGNSVLSAIVGNDGATLIYAPFAY